jgi:hypothetical protein
VSNRINAILKALNSDDDDALTQAIHDAASCLGASCRDDLDDLDADYGDEKSVLRAQLLRALKR